MTACVVEDHVQLREQIVALLASAGVEVLAAVGSVAEGSKAVCHHLPTVAVIDNQLPDGRGIDLCRALTAAAPGVRLLLHTGVVTVDDEREARAAGAEAVIPKSIRGLELLQAIGA